MANAAIAILMFGILATRFIDMSPVTEYRLTSLLNILLVIVFAVYALPAPAGSIISVAFVAIVAYLVVRYVPQPLSADAIFGFKVRYLSALGLSLFVAIVAISFLRKTIADLVQKQKELEVAQQELNHRVKNNLAIVSSFISLKETESNGAIDLSDVRNRVNAIAMIHEKLQFRTDSETLAVRSFFSDILNSVVTSTPFEIIVDGEIVDLRMPTRTAVSLGLIISEFATNAIKHGFSKESPAHITLAVTRDEPGSGTVVFSNTGRPLPSDFDFDTTDTLGLQLVKMPADQIGATLEVKKQAHPVFTIRFPIPIIPS